MYTLRPDQQKAVQVAVEFLSSASRGQSKPIIAPTGSGKSYVEAELLRLLGPTHHQIVPSLEIAWGIGKKIGQVDTGSERRIRESTEALGIFTAMRYRNLLLGGNIRLPSTICFDELHHTEATTYEEVWELTGRKPRTGLTATWYRGTPEGTKELHSHWGNDPYTMLTLEEAIEGGIVSLPSFSIWPLLNDDIIKVVNGEFHVKSVDAMAKDKMSDLVLRMAPWYDGSHWDRPTMLAVSSVEQVKYAEYTFKAQGLPVVSVVADSRDRESLFARCVDRTHVLIQVKVVGEGVDLPLRRLIDLSPTMSPVAWMQRVGRIMRPVGEGEQAPEYIAGCHNLTRHAYLFHGLIPADQVRKAQQVWGDDWKPTRRGMSRALGLEGFGKFAPCAVPLADGLTGAFYGLQTKTGDEQWGIFLHPVNPQPLFFTRRNEWYEGEDHLLKKLPNGVEIRGRKRKYMPWRLIQSMPDVEGCVSLPPNPLTPGQLGLWKRDGERYGLDKESVVNAKQFQILPMLKDVGVRIRSLT